MTLKQIKGIPIFDISKRTYLGQYIGHDISFLDGKKVWNIYIGQYEVYGEDDNNRIYPMLINGLPTPYFLLFIQNKLNIRMFYEREKIFEKIGINDENIINLDYCINGRDSILFIDIYDVFEDVDVIRNLDYHANIKEIFEKHKRKIKTLKELAKDYKRLYEVEKKEKEVIETILERYRMIYENMRLTIIEMENEILKLKTIVNRLHSQTEIQEEEKQKIENMFFDLLNFIKNLEKYIQKIKTKEDKND